MANDPKNKSGNYLLPDRLTESYIITTSRRKVGIYGERFIDTLVHATKQEDSPVYSGGIVSIVQESDDSRTLTFSIKRLMSNPLDTNYSDAEDAMRKLEAVFLEFRADGVWKSRALITDPEIDSNNHTGTFRVPGEIWEAVKDRSEGFRAFNPVMGYKLSSETAYRLYKLICGQKRPLSFMLSDLRSMLELQDKYKRLADFQSRVLDAARNELLESAEWYFDYKLDVSERSKSVSKRGRPAYDKITFFPKLNSTVKDVVSVNALAEQNTKGNVVMLLPDNLVNHLKNKYEFTDAEIKNSHIIVPAHEIMQKGGESLLEFLLDNTERIDGANKKKPYLLKMVKRHVYEKYSVVIGSAKTAAALTSEGNSPRQGELFSLSDIVKPQNV